ncbi:MAG: sodium:alanine symporter family protein [Deltaproteobacteria bacterium]|nr:sodium:alanine symporter family protein [Deltaproteobacteria bacterium]
MESLQALVETLNYYVWSFGIPIGDETIPLVVLLLIGTGLFLTVRLGFVQFRRLGHGAAVATGRYDDPDDPGDVSHFQALSTALSATVGIGNIGGVAIAIHWGGPGALFWMWLTALVGMATKFAEVTLAQRYRAVEKEQGGNSVAGGPMYYIERGLGPAWRPLALFFAVMLGLTAFLTGNGVQSNTVADTIEAIFSVDPMITGAITAAIVAAVILGGIRRIGRVTAILAPAMALLYVGTAATILLMNAGQILPTLGLIIDEAFNPTAGVAGTGVGAILVTMMWGVKRGLFSNEAGQGSAPIAHAAAKTDEPVSEGVVALLEPFIDTIVICTMTALVIVMTGVWSERVPTEVTLGGGDLSYVTAKADGAYETVEEPGPILVTDGVPAAGGTQPAWHDVPVERVYIDEAKTSPFSGVIDPGGKRATARDGTTHDSLWSDAVESGAPLTMLGFRRGLSSLGDFGHYVVLLCVVLFGISTAISWSYYGDRCANYVLGAKAVLPYRIVFVGMHFLGAVLPLKLAWDLGDVLLGIVILPNLIALVMLSPQVVEMTRDYFRRRPWRHR